MHSSFSLSRHNCRYHINIMMSDVLYGMLTSQLISQLHTKESKIFCFSCSVWR